MVVELLLCEKSFDYIWGRATGNAKVDTRGVKIPYNDLLITVRLHNVYYYLCALHRGYVKYYKLYNEKCAELEQLQVEKEKAELHKGLKALFDSENQPKQDFGSWRQTGGTVGRGNLAHAQVLADAMSGKSIAEIQKTGYQRSKRGKGKRYGLRSIENVLRADAESINELYLSYPEEFTNRGVSAEMVQAWNYKMYRKLVK